MNMRIVVIGGSGHIGTYLTPRLVEAGHDTVVVSRGMRRPYQPHPAWDRVSRVTADRQAEEATGDFGRRIRDLNPHAVIDLTCYTPQSARQLVEALAGSGIRLLHCGTIWVHGPAVERPVDEEQPRQPFGEYGCRKAEIEAYLLAQARSGFPVTVLHPGHLVGPGWKPINPAANFNLEVFADLARGSEIALPNLGNETLHHVHADDVAQAFVCALNNWENAAGESFHVVSPAALTLRGYAETVAGWFGRQALLRFLPWDEWRRQVSDRDAAVTWDHIARSPNCSIEKARRLLGYAPRYRSADAIKQAVDDLIASGAVAV
jgi:nucleoside-diphosphate-sugar epimerase